MLFWGFILFEMFKTIFDELLEIYAMPVIMQGCSVDDSSMCVANNLVYMYNYYIELQHTFNIPYSINT